MKVPSHVAIIMDGNGRWAEERGFARAVGHKVGAESVREIIRACIEIGIEHLTLYSFSMENWQRPREEINYLMQLLEFLLKTEIGELNRNGVSIKVIGRVEKLPKSVKMEVFNAIEKTKNNKKLKLYLALSYGGRQEIVDAVNKIIREKKKKINEISFRKYLYEPEMPDPDLLIRTAGEQRISNFLLWQISYTELYFTNVLWPDFRKEEFLKTIEDYSRRKRKFGRVI
ncbi:MAG: isoprenyl transferase [candidate division WOR-3 bacterium]|nr:isoprenyl transferase [candidate division WOR-3 bacterium]MCX7947362.1 isoprenyl transferase [candidate division WOR-3 bacterium]MDW8150082.1 isoprenyl transferase [candidate division WOR-3 bacterium]